MILATKRLTLTGDIVANSGFVFAAHYAGRLDLTGRYQTSPNGETIIELRGAPELIDMFEIAFWLGPSDAMIDSISVEDVENPNWNNKGFVKV